MGHVQKADQGMPALVVKPYLEGQAETGLTGRVELQPRLQRGDTNRLFKGKATSSKMNVAKEEELGSHFSLGFSRCNGI